MFGGGVDATGPQGDVIRINNFVRAVRDMGVTKQPSHTMMQLRFAVAR